MKVVGIIPSRYASSRFPGKPLADICGKPMIWWVYQQCKKAPVLDEVYVATDDERIAAVCRREEIPVLMTSDAHPTGSDRVGEAASMVEGDLFVNIQGDEPLIDPGEIAELIRLFEDPEVYFGTLKTEITDIDEIQADSTVKVVTDSKGDALFFSRSVIPSNKRGGQKARIFRHVGIYAYRREFLTKFCALGQSDLEISESVEPLRALENGFKIRVAETSCVSIGVDYPEHIKLVEAIIRGN